LTEAIKQVVNAEVLPAYRRFAEFIAKDYAPRGRTSIGMSSLPDGARRYQQAIREQTTTDMSPAEIHALGLREVTRITGLLTDLAHQAGYQDLASFRAALNSDPRYVAKSAVQIVDDFRRYVGQMQPRLPELFGVFPDAPYGGGGACFAAEQSDSLYFWDRGWEPACAGGGGHFELCASQTAAG
jgi:uncharacterized protein (DUF885 family)